MGAIQAARRNNSPVQGIMARLALLGCGLVLIAAVGDLLVLICKWSGYVIIAYVVCGALFRLVFEEWPNWVTRPCARIQSWLEP